MNNKAPIDSPYCLYSFFLFNQLYNDFVNPDYKYSQNTYKNICKEFGKYCDSEFNDENLAEYECIVDYLKSIDTK
jgi:hypothetical protein